MFQSRFLAFSKTVATQRSAFLKNQKNSLQAYLVSAEGCGTGGLPARQATEVHERPAENHRLSAEIFNTLIIE